MNSTATTGKISVKQASGFGQWYVYRDGENLGLVFKVEQRVYLAGGRGNGTLLVHWRVLNVGTLRSDDRTHYGTRAEAAAAVAAEYDARSIVPEAKQLIDDTNALLDTLQGEVASAGSIKNGVVTAFDGAPVKRVTTPTAYFEVTGDTVEITKRTGDREVVRLNVRDFKVAVRALFED